MSDDATDVSIGRLTTMQPRHAPAASSKSAYCYVCLQPLSRAELIKPDQGAERLCSDFACQRLFAQKQTLSPQAFEHQLRFQRQLIVDRRQKEQQNDERIAALDLLTEKQNQALLQCLLDDPISPLSHHSPVISLPVGKSGQPGPDTARREKYETYLRSIIAQCHDYVAGLDAQIDQQRSVSHDQVFHTMPELAQRSDQLCAICKGGCCTQGGETAHLSAATIVRLLESDTGLNLELILQSYLDYLPEKSIEGACINQTPSGCALPRDWRSDVCNNYYCEPLKSYQKMLVAQHSGERGRAELEPLLVVQRDSCHWRRYDADAGPELISVMVLDEQGVRRQTLSPEVHEAFEMPRLKARSNRN